MIDIKTNPQNTQTILGVCAHDCPDTCAWQVTVKDGQAVELRGDPEHPFTKGGLCAKVNHYIERVYSPERILTPLRRIGAKGEGRFEAVSWEWALEHIAGQLHHAIDEYGGESILPYTSAGTQGFIQFGSIDRRFFARVGASRLSRTLCGDTANAGLKATQGNAYGIDPEDLRHSQLIVLWGTNTIVTNLHLWPFIREAQKKGAKVVCIDPLRTRTAEKADWHLPILPGTDAALALGMMHVIVRDGLQDDDYIRDHTFGFEQLKERIQAYTPERVAAITGLSAEDIETFARMYATARPAVIRLLIGLEHHQNGAMMFRTIACLPGLTGAWRERGGGLTRSMYAYPIEALDMDYLLRPDLENPSTREINIAQLGRALTDETLSPPVKVLMVHSCNPATITMNQNLVRRGLEREDLFMVVHEQFMTDTARYADVVLPATTGLEHLDIVPSWGHLYLALNQPAIKPLGQSLPNTEFFRQLSKAMGLDEDYLQESDESLIRGLLGSGHRWLEGITFERLQAEGWARLALPEDWRPFANGGFTTPSGRLEFYSQTLKQAGFDPLPTYTPPEESLAHPEHNPLYPLQLITTRAVHFLNSQYVNLPRQRKAEKEPMLELHPADAAERSIGEGDWVEVCNARGAVRIRATLSTRVRPGLAAMPFAWWGSIGPNINANALTTDRLSDWGGGVAFHDTMVQVRLAQQVAA